MIRLPEKPTKTILSAEGSIDLDKTYKYTLFKSINGSTSYEVKVHDVDCDITRSLVENTVINFCKTHGAFEPKKEA